MADVEVGQVGERRPVRGDNCSASCHCCCCDQQIMRSARRALAAHLDEQPRMNLSDRDVIGDHWDHGEYVLQERGPRRRRLSRSEERTDSELGDRNRRDGDIVLIGDHIIKGVARPVGVDEERRVEQEPSQDRSSTSSNRRMEDSSADQLASRRCRRSRAFASAPRPGLAGSRWAMGFPRRMTVKCSPRCSTASRMSAKFRAASVALTSGTRSDYQMCRRMSPRSPSTGLQWTMSAPGSGRARSPRSSTQTVKGMSSRTSSSPSAMPRLRISPA